ncbi:MAG: hypothetical protein ACJ72H_30355 [Candidatus Sulfotelmatobacter sp.]|jgi:hypothetical protein
MLRTKRPIARLRDVRGETLVLKIALHDCPHCCRSEIYVSTPDNIREEILILLLLRPVRCRSCMARFYRPLWVPTPLNPKLRVGTPK